MDIICELFQNYDCESLKVNFLTSIVFLLISLIISILVIPRITVLLIARKNSKFEFHRISFVISEFLRFFNPVNKPIYKDNSTKSVFLKESKESLKFLGLVPIQLLSKLGKAEISLSILQLGQDQNPDKLIKYLEAENIRIFELEKSIENIISIHGSNMDELHLQKLSTLCLNIKSYREYFSNNQMSEKLGIKREGVFGIGDLENLYKEKIELLSYFLIKYKRKINIV